MARTGRPRVERVTLPCEACGTPIVRRKSDVDRLKTGRVFCDKQCRALVGPKPRRGYESPCEQCGEPFYRSQSADRRFCSKACHDAWQGRNGVYRECEACGVSFRRPPSWSSRQPARFCSKRCEGLNRIARPLDWDHNGKPAIMDDHGYVYVWEPEHPAATRKKGWIAEHRLVAERLLNRTLTAEDEVHHINRIRHDNRPENLDVLDGVTHARITANQRQSDKDLLAEYIRRFGPLNDFN